VIGYMFYVHTIEMELKSDMTKEVVELAKRMLDYNKEHFNHSFDVLIPETGKLNRILVLHRFNDNVESEKLGAKQGADPKYVEMQNELIGLVNDVKRSIYTSL
jgi:hypothetical protein